MKISFLVFLNVMFLFQPVLSQEFEFEIPQEEASVIAFSGNLDVKWGFLDIRKNSLLYKLNFFNQKYASSFSQYRMDFYFNGDYQHKQVGFTMRSFYQYSKEGPIDPTFFELHGDVNLSPKLSAGIGKRRFFWGKGYAFNPVGYVNTEKDPENPDLALTGIISGYFNYNKSYDSHWLQNFSLTGVIIPKEGEINNKFAQADETGFAVKLYFLLRDIDLDFMMFQQKNEPQQYGFDFSTNLKTNLEIHGEVSYNKNDSKTYVAQDAMQQKKMDGVTYLFGIRFLNSMNTTFIAEYYHQNHGLTDSEFNNLLKFIRSKTASDNREIVEQTRINFSRSFQTRTLMRDYLYVKLSQPEPFGWLYSAVNAFTIYNLNDDSFTLSAQLVYKPFTNFEFLVWPTFFVGDDNSEYGSKPFERKIEMWLRFYF